MSTSVVNPAAVEAIGLTKIYGSGNTEVVAMRDVSLRVARGEVIALLGPSAQANPLLTPSASSIRPPPDASIGGEWVMDADQAKVDLRAFRRRHLGFVFQRRT